mmetsp:Transcript_20759/g.43715  ORF Transcript_20759/g.43715 Transcript_20759/m.43715 type:complete len:124 (-) Transcript_20759:85-456(-)
MGDWYKSKVKRFAFRSMTKSAFHYFLNESQSHNRRGLGILSPAHPPRMRNPCSYSQQIDELHHREHAKNASRNHPRIQIPSNGMPRVRTRRMTQFHQHIGRRQCQNPRRARVNAHGAAGNDAR